MWFLIPIFAATALLAVFVGRRRRKAIGPAGADKGDFDVTRAWWMNQFIKSLDPSDVAAMRPPVDAPIKGGVEYIASRTFGLVEGTIFYREPSGVCEVVLKKRRQADDGSLALDWERLGSYRASSAPAEIAKLIIDCLTGKTEVERPVEAPTVPVTPPDPPVDPFDPVPEPPSEPTAQAPSPTASATGD